MRHPIKSAPHLLSVFLAFYLFSRFVWSTSEFNKNFTSEEASRFQTYPWIGSKKEKCLIYPGNRPQNSSKVCFDVYVEVLSSYKSKCSSSSYSSPTLSRCPLEIATQFSMERLVLLFDLIEKWDGTLSASILITNFEYQIPYLFQKIFGLECDDFKRLQIHLVVGEPEDPYPINFLRNIALEKGRKEGAPLVAVFDIDFIPSPFLCEKIMSWNSVSYLANLSNSLPDPVLPPLGKCPVELELPEIVYEQKRFLLILPSFEIPKTKPFLNRIFCKKLKDEVEYPETKKELLARYSEGQIIRFHNYFDGQEMNLSKWFNTNTPFFHSPPRTHNEHYAWFSWKEYRRVSNEKLCDEYFFDRGVNKIACYLQLRISGFVPVVIPDGWLIHESNSQPFKDFLNKKHITRRLNSRYPLRLFSSFCSKIEPFGWIQKLQACQFCNDEEASAEYDSKKQLCYSAISYSQGLSPAFNPIQTCTKNLTQTPPLQDKITTKKKQNTRVSEKFFEAIHNKLAKGNGTTRLWKPLPTRKSSPKNKTNW